jgi:signal transduction histidine kinase
VHWHETLASGIERLRQGAIDVVLLDLGLPDSEPASTLHRVLADARDVPVVVLTTSEDSGQALQAVKAGAQDHLPKPRVSADLLSRAIRYAIERKRSEQQLRQFNETLERRVAERTHVAEHRARAMQRLATELGQAERRERRRLALFLHDDLQQILAAARMRLDLLSRRVRDTPHAESVREIVDLVGQCIQSSRTLATDLSPPVLNERGLGAALHWLARRQKDRHDLDVDVCLKGDDQRLSQDASALLLDISRELLFNVVKHAKVKHARVTLDCDAQPMATLTIEDEGAGFDAAPVLRADASAEHFGILSISERLEAIGARMKLDSAPGKGTRITIQILYAGDGQRPDDQSSPDFGIDPGAAGIAPAGRAGNSKRVLVVDDHELVREGLAAAIAIEPDLRLVGTAADGASALQMLQSQAADVVVLDISMPGLNGIEVTSRIKQRWPHVQVIGLSMHEAPDVEKAMHDAGAFIYLTKTAPTQHLLDAIRNATAGV